MATATSKPPAPIANIRYRRRLGYDCRNRSGFCPEFRSAPDAPDGRYRFLGGEPDAVLFGDALDKAVVVGVFKAGLQGVVVDIGNARSVLTRGTPIASNSR